MFCAKTLGIKKGDFPTLSLLAQRKSKHQFSWEHGKASKILCSTAEVATTVTVLRAGSLF